MFLGGFLKSNDTSVFDDVADEDELAQPNFLKHGNLQRVGGHGRTRGIDLRVGHRDYHRINSITISVTCNRKALLERKACLYRFLRRGIKRKV
jgi:hypothetical protein